jgi:AhpD family alkylhydroperoxidase
VDSQLDQNQDRQVLRDKYVKLLPDLADAELEVNSLAYADGALLAKHKRLIALGIALGRGCENCVLGQTQRALEAGATVDEILETTGVAVAIGGTMGMAESLRVVRLLEEMGKL